MGRYLVTPHAGKGPWVIKRGSQSCASQAEAGDLWRSSGVNSTGEEKLEAANVLQEMLESQPGRATGPGLETARDNV